MKRNREYPLDNSAMIHFATRKKWYSNSYRFETELKEDVDAVLLQAALQTVVPRFPTIAAGIEKSFFRFSVVPVKEFPELIPEREDVFLPCMTPEEISRCAFRVYYGKRKFAVEFFHSLTDGYGAMVFMNTLLAEYLKLKHQIILQPHSMILEPGTVPDEAELKDDYYTFAGEKKAPLSTRRSYQIPGKPDGSGRILTTCLSYEMKDLLDAAKRHQTTLTVLLTAVMAASAAEIQKKYSPNGVCRKPVQIMVPINLRKLFPSTTLRNFSLFALPSVDVKNCGLSAAQLIPIIEKQIREQASAAHMAAVMATHTEADRAAVMRLIPVGVKLQVMKVLHLLFGEPCSCISLSNLGNLALSEEMAEHVDHMEVFLTPRVKSPYNCGIISCRGRCYINFSRFCESAELELCFTRHLKQIMAS